MTLAGRNSLFGRGQAGGEEEAGEVVEEEDAQPKLAEPAVVIDNEKYTQNVYYEKNAQNVPQDLEEEEERVFLIDSDSSSSSMRAICASTEQILRATCLLFGSAVTVNAEILSRDPRHALCWVAKAWADRAGLAAPQGLIYKRLAGRVTPPLYLLRDPMQGLPNNYLVAIGMAEVEAVPGKVCWRCMRNPCQCEEEADE